MDTGLKGKTVLLTGASGGIGSEIARMFDKEGSKQILIYLRGKVEIKQLEETLKGEYISISANLTKEEDIDNVFKKGESRFGRIDVLVACAGIWTDAKYITDRTLEEWNNCFQINSTASFLLARGFFRNLRKYKEDYASVVFFGSTAGILGEAMHHDYAATKAAVIYGLTKSLRIEIIDFAKYGRVNTVIPGWTTTPMAEDMLKDKQYVNKIVSTIPLRKIGKPEDSAAAVIFLASDVTAGHITGEVIPVYGGMQGRLLYGELKSEQTSKKLS